MPPLSSSGWWLMHWFGRRISTAKTKVKSEVQEFHLGNPCFKRLQDDLCLPFPWEPYAYTLPVQLHQLYLSRGNPLFQPASDKMTLRSALPSGAGADAIPQHTLQEVAWDTQLIDVHSRNLVAGWGGDWWSTENSLATESNQFTKILTAEVIPGSNPIS